jgi:hypothetical protein
VSPLCQRYFQVDRSELKHGWTQLPVRKTTAPRCSLARVPMGTCSRPGNPPESDLTLAANTSMPCIESDTLVHRTGALCALAFGQTCVDTTTTCTSGRRISFVLFQHVVDLSVGGTTSYVTRRLYMALGSGRCPAEDSREV